MRWAVLILVLANVALAGYLVLIDRGARPAADVRSLELNADKVTVLGRAGDGQAKTACLEWGNLAESDMERAQQQLITLGPNRYGVRGRAIVIADPSPALIARLAELRPAFFGSELKAVACDPNAP